ncbi:MAG: fibronectin type III domain-containing protein, partial [Candidatus Planktophila sp.]
MRTRVLLILTGLIGALLLPIAQPASAFGGLASAPTSVAHTAIAGGIRVTWSAPTDADTGITGYRVEYSTTGTTGTWTLWATEASATYSSDILGLAQNATFVRVAATTSAGAGAYG